MNPKITLNRVFDHISQRVVCSYVNSLSDLPSAASPSQRDLHAFFQSLYSLMFNQPALFGLPLDPDASVLADHYDKEEKQEVTRKVKKPKDLAEQGLGFLLNAGIKGRLDDLTLRLDAAEVSAFTGKSKARKQFLQGLEAAGLQIELAGGEVALSSEPFPHMAPAWKALAEACAQNGKVGLFNFARCDFGGLDPAYAPPAMELYKVFNPEDFRRVSQLHAYMTSLNYKPEYQYYGMSGWEVQYQGRKEIKSTPLLRIEYSERYRNQLRIGIKCASSNRLVPLIYEQPIFLQEDFFKRAYGCNGDKCKWCATKKNLGPSVLELNGQSRIVCWYSNPDIVELDDHALRLIEQYVVMHEQLA